MEVVFDATRHEPDVDLIFLSNKASATLGTACARGATDFHVTGAKTATSVMATTNPTQVRIPIGEAEEGDFQTILSDVYTSAAAGGAKTVDLSDRMRVGMTTSRIALGIDGTVGNTMMGQSSVPLSDLFENATGNRSTVVDVSYMNYMAIACSVSLSNPKLVLAGTDTEVVPHFVEDAKIDAACAAGQGALETLYTKGAALRQIVVFDDAPNLSKSVMRVPYGIDGSTFDACSNVVDRPTAMSDQAFESIAKACLTHTLAVDEAGDRAVPMATFLSDAATPGVAAAKHAGKVANTLSMIVNLVCPYRIDGRTAVLPTGLKMVDSESWKAEAPRNISSFDDCDGSGAIQTSLVYRAETIARDPELAAEFPHVAAISNALVHHMVGVCVLAANAGQADNAGKHGHAAVAGHAIALAVPKLHALTAMVTGIKATGTLGNDSDQMQKSLEMAERMTEPFATALYHPDDLNRMPTEEAAMLATAEGRTKLEDLLEAEPLALEGTSPVASCKMYERDTNTRLDQVRYARTEKSISAKIGPAVTRAVSRLHVPLETGAPEHMFYKELVEFSVPLRRYGTFQNAEMREGGVAAAEWVFTSANNVQSAGVGPKDMALGNYLMLPLWQLGTEECEALDVSSAEVLANTLPVRAGPLQLSERETGVYNENKRVLKELSDKHATVFNAHAETHHKARHVVAFAALVGNEASLPLFAKAIDESSSIKCRVTFQPTPGVILDATGNDVGVMPYIELIAT